MTKLFIHALLLICFIVRIEAKNPLEGQRFYLDPTFQYNIDRTLENISPNETDSEKIKNSLRIARDSSTAQWLNNMSKVQPNSTAVGSMNAVLTDAAKQKPIPLVLFVINNVPNRDCGQNTLKSEICCTTGADNACDYTTQGDCAQGLRTYKASFIDNIVTVTKMFKDIVPMAFVIEPHAIGAMATDLHKPKCANPATQVAYKESVVYAINELSKNSPATPLYLDLGHGGWLGWEENAQNAAKLVNSWNILDKIRGFSINVANYQPVGEACPEAFYCLPSNNQTSHSCCADPCGLEKRLNSANNELNYALRMQTLFPGKFYIVDTGRNGVPNARSNCSNWCNIRNAGFGIPPTTKTPLPLIDAFMWIKTPGDSNGCTLTLPNWSTCPVYDEICESPDSIGTAPGEPRMPESGKFLEYQMKLLARNANFNN